MPSHPPGDQGSDLQIHPERCQLQRWGDEEGCGEGVTGPIPPQGGRQCPIFPGRLPHLTVQVNLILPSSLFMVSSPLRYIRQCIAKADTPHLMLMSKDRVYSSLPHNDFQMPGMRNGPLLKVFSPERHLFQPTWGRWPPVQTHPPTPQIPFGGSTTHLGSATLSELRSWYFDFRIHILWASYVNVKDVDLIYVR